MVIVDCAHSYSFVNDIYAMRPETIKFGKITQNNAKIKAISTFKVIQGHRFWYQSKAHTTSYQNDS